jgi:hypothetical protein
MGVYFSKDLANASGVINKLLLSMFNSFSAESGESTTTVLGITQRRKQACSHVDKSPVQVCWT